MHTNGPKIAISLHQNNEEDKHQKTIAKVGAVNEDEKDKGTSSLLPMKRQKAVKDDTFGSKLKEVKHTKDMTINAFPLAILPPITQ